MVLSSWNHPVKSYKLASIGLVEAVAAIGLIYAIRYPDELIGWLAILVLWIAMGIAVFAHSKANKMKTSAPAVVLLLLLSVVLVIN